MTPTPNHALQRTAPRVTVAAISGSDPSRPCGALSYARGLFLRPTPQLPRHAPPSLSFGSLGASAHPQNQRNKTMKHVIIVITLLFSQFASARDAGSITLTPASPEFYENPAGSVFAGDPDIWSVDLSAFSGAVSLTITLLDYYPPLPDDYDVTLNGVFIGNTLTATPGRTFQVSVPPTTSQLKIAYVNAHTGYIPDPGGSGYNLRIVASLANPDPLTSTIATYAGIKITGTIGATYRVEYTFDLSTPNWIKLADVILPSSPYIQFDLVPMNETPKRFYRVSAIPNAPNQALQRTAPAVTLAAPPPSPTQPSRQPPPSLSLGSLGVARVHPTPI